MKQDYFDKNDIIKYEGVEELVHTYSNKRLNSKGEQIDFNKVENLVNEIRSDIVDWYENETGNELVFIELKEDYNLVKNKFHSDERFKQVFDILEISYDNIKHASIPWWNEITAGELEHKINDDKAVISFSPVHSIETQVMRQGVNIPIKNVSVGGLVFTNDDYIVLGLRAGNSYNNTFNIIAGALKASYCFINYETSIKEMFKELELKPELGLKEEDINNISIFSRTFDRMINKGSGYIFKVDTNLSKNEMNSCWENNTHKDKNEHYGLEFVKVDEINDFIKNNYVCQVENRKRNDDERYLLHPAALALASFSQMKIDELKNLYKEGIF